MPSIALRGRSSNPKPVVKRRTCCGPPKFARGERIPPWAGLGETEGNEFFKVRGRLRGDGKSTQG